MGLSFDGDSITLEASIESLRFVVVNSILEEAGSMGGIVDQRGRTILRSNPVITRI